MSTNTNPDQTASTSSGSALPDASFHHSSSVDPIDAATFHRELLPYGGAVDVSQLEEPAQTNIRRFRDGGRLWVASFRDSRQTAPLGLMPHVHLDFVNSLELQALAFSASGRDFIAIYLGTYALLQDLFLRMLSVKEVLPEIGDIGQENDNPQKLPGLVLDFGEVIALWQKGEVAHPNIVNSQRIEYAHFLLATTIQFLIAHELAHLRNGHVEMINTMYSGRPLNEVGATGATGLSSLTSQTLEMDADAWATVQTFIASVERVKPGPETKPWTTEKNPVVGAAFSFVFATYSLFRLFSAGEDPSLPAEKLSHPPARERQAMVMSTVVALLEREGHSDLVPECIDAMVAAVLSAENAVAHVTGQTTAESFLQSGFRELYSETNRKYCKSLTDHWAAVVRAQLLPFTRAVDLPA